MAETTVSTPVGDYTVSNVSVAIHHDESDVVIDVDGPPAPPSRKMVPYEINIFRTSSGSVVAHDFPSTEWTCTQPAAAWTNPFTVTCTPVVDEWRCVAMPVSAHSLAPNWSVRGRVQCTNSLSTAWTTWPAPKVAASTSLGNAPVVTCTAEGRVEDSVDLPIEHALSTDTVTHLPRVLQALAVVAPVPDIDNVKAPSTTLHAVKCGPDPYVP